MKPRARIPGKPGKKPGAGEPVAEYRTEPGPVINVDATGRMVRPKKIRDHYNATKFVIKQKGTLSLIPVKPLSSLSGVFPDMDLEAVYRDHDREVEEKDADDRSRYPC
jgi:hypothetical protein